MGEWTWDIELAVALKPQVPHALSWAAPGLLEFLPVIQIERNTPMTTPHNNDQPEPRRSDKVRNALVWAALVALAVFPFPWWP